MEDDPEFLELSVRQRRAIDRAFARGLRAAKGRPSKRRRLNTSGPTTGPATPSGENDGGGFIAEDDAGGFLPDEGGGFIDDGGGFIPDDDAGGFIPEDDTGGLIPDDDDEGVGGGGFMVDDEASAGPSAGPSTRASRAASTNADSDDRLPLRLMPNLLSALGLPSDEDVLSVFRAMDDNGVRHKDFRAVCAALMPPDDAPPSKGDDGDEGEDNDDEDSDWDMSSGSDSDNFEPSDDEEYGAPKGKGKAATKSRRAKALEDTGRAKLLPRQREVARALWGLVKPDEKGGILSRDEVKRWARELGEMWSDDEITDMVTLFSGQHEGRGLTFEDFGVVMLRAGLV
ncbi:hypothetical protein CC85DRAFT_305902 [Cutaneotrichosporon oleaginosum]|uniref:EF-hand domain-containing protein n=1 Tax=Cutaneotrichosporon oleaginosum TaxID=879819 RepID=A0A0J0XBS1_9TREE|nr:uncharacterized protein CC85DRAFT_305902 [Cutaneotrichosporon oleaginosum]KLT38511.1 hypothetical protein CC85DRAFT_305902 [Cutaneotrichosporon oleaginosum]TXT12297.1 hypothetical protein COLE_02707 [Cutaneotrichosporon oleaginosum]